MNDVRARVEGAVARFAREYAPWRPDETVVAAVSGGADSLCMLGALLALQSEQPELAPGQIVVAHLDHGLRGEAGAADAAWVGAFAERLGLDCVAGQADVGVMARREHRSLEDAARRARYAFLRGVAAEHGAARICAGHTRDDQAETIVMHWLRGSGLTGLSGMRPLTGDVARPLLAVSRGETVAYCAARGWEPRCDATNDDPVFLRNRIRHVLLPELEQYNPNLRDTLVREAELFREDDEYLEDQARALWLAAVEADTPAAVRFAAHSLRAAPRALCRRVLRRAALHVMGAGADGPEAVHILALEALLARGRTGASLDLPGRLRVTLEYDTLSFERHRHRIEARTAARAAEPVVELDVPGSVELRELGWRLTAAVEPRAPQSAWRAPTAAAAAGVVDPETGYRLVETEARLDADVAGDGLQVRQWQPGDRMHPLGMPGRKKLQDIFADAKVPRSLRRRLPLVMSGAHLLWVAGLRIDDRARITPHTRRVLRLRLEPLPPGPLEHASPTIKDDRK